MRWTIDLVPPTGWSGFRISAGDFLGYFFDRSKTVTEQRDYRTSWQEFAVGIKLNKLTFHFVINSTVVACSRQIVK
jgi:hypothetical protein